MAKAILCILDGFGFGDKSDPFNAVEQAVTPTIDYLKNNYQISSLKTSGEALGLPTGQMGNSEVGHMAIGSGRIIKQTLSRINSAIENGELQEKILNILKNEKNIHLIGLLSDGGVHGNGTHVMALANLLKNAGKNLFIHGISDGRDSPPNSGLEYLTEFDKKCKITTLCGRFFAMDRDNNVERTEKYYNLVSLGQGDHINIKDGIIKSYLANINDEHIDPIVCDENYTGIKKGDTVIFCNFRADRIKQIAIKLIGKNELGIKSSVFMTDYLSETETSNLALKPNILFIKEEVKNCLAEVLCNNNLTQLHVAETEKYAHVTFFFNGGIEDSFVGEDRILVPSPKVKTYDLQPEMSCQQVVKSVIDNVEKYDFIVLNIANCDMVGHTGNFEATKKAVEFVDKQINILVKKCENDNIPLLITADHGNSECMMDKNFHQHTQHTTFDVPLILVSKNYNFLNKNGDLSDVAPTLLQILNIKQPIEMSGKSLLLKNK